MAESAAEAALEGKLEKARQRFAMAIAGTTNTRILFLAFKFYLRTGDIETAEEVVQRRLAVGMHNSVDLAVAYSHLGIVHYARGNLDEAETMHRKALDLREELGDKQGMANQFGNLGNAHERRGNSDEAEAMYRKALDLHDELGDKQGMANQFGNLGIMYQKRGDLDEAEAMYRKALVLFEELGSPTADSVRQSLFELDAETGTQRK